MSRGYAPNEAEFQRAVTDAATLHGWRWNHTRKAMVRHNRVATPTSTTGWPDLVLWHPKHGVWFVELKTDAGRLSGEQEEVLSSLCEAGAHVDVWRPSLMDGRVLPILRGETPCSSDSPADSAGVLVSVGDPSSPPRGPQAETGSVGSQPRGGEPVPSLDDQMQEALWRQREHVIASHHVDRRGWTRDQYIADARRLFGDLDGSVLDLVNGHIMAMLDEIDALNGRWLKRGGLPNWKQIAVNLAIGGADWIRLTTREADALRTAVADSEAIEADSLAERTADAATYHQEDQ